MDTDKKIDFHSRYVPAEDTPRFDDDTIAEMHKVVLEYLGSPLSDLVDVLHKTFGMTDSEVRAFLTGWMVGALT